jgi:hypothetical protein
MVALIQDGASGAPIGIHRTYLDPSGSGKAPVENPKMMLGQCRGGAVKFGTFNDQLVVAEGIETALSFKRYKFRRGLPCHVSDSRALRFLRKLKMSLSWQMVTNQARKLQCLPLRDGNMKVATFASAERHMDMILTTF